MLTDFHNFFTDRLSSKFAITSTLNIPPHLTNVAKLPCEIRVKNAVLKDWINRIAMKDSATQNRYLYLYLWDDGLRSKALIAHIGPVLVEPILECVYRWCSHDMFRKTIPMWHHSLTKEEFPDVQSGSFDRDLHAMSSQIIYIVWHFKKFVAGNVLLSRQYFIRFNKISSLPSSF